MCKINSKPKKKKKRKFQKNILKEIVGIKINNKKVLHTFFLCKSKKYSLKIIKSKSKKTKYHK